MFSHDDEKVPKFLHKNERAFYLEKIESQKVVFKAFPDYVRIWGKGVSDINKKKCLVRQRRTIDSWGRMLILKPDR